MQKSDSSDSGKKGWHILPLFMETSATTYDNVFQKKKQNIF